MRLTASAGALPETVLLDNEAVSVLLDPHHRQHKALMAYFVYIGLRKVRVRGKRTTTGPQLCVPVAVRVEANWDRRQHNAALEKEARIVADIPMTSQSADEAADIKAACDVSVPDAHIGASLSCTEGPHAVITSDSKDVQAMAAYRGLTVNVVLI